MLPLVFTHIAAWILYALFVFVTIIIGKPATTIWNVLLYIIPFVATFYLSVYCLNLYKEKGVWWSVASFFIVFIVMVTIGYFYIYTILPAIGMVLYTSEEYRIFIVEAILAFLRIFSFALIYFYIRQIFEKERSLRIVQKQKAEQEMENARLSLQKLKAEKEKLQYEHAILRTQINPHFLYNSLNTLFSQALNYNSDLADNISKLSLLMRYSVEALELESTKVSARKELDNLQAFIDIHNLRFGNKNPVNMELTGKINGQLVPPFSLITLVENAFKYGNLKDPLYPLIIKIRLEKDSVYFFCKNKIRHEKDRFPSYSIGLSNLKKRLDIAFKNKHELSIFQDDDFYTTELILKT